MPNVLHVYRTYFPDTQGGLEEAIRQICISQANRGVANRVLATSKSPSPQVIERPEATVIRVKKHLEIASCSMSVDFLRELHRQCEWADVINFHFPWPFADLIWLLSPFKRPYVITYHSDVVRQKILNFLYMPLARWFLSNASKIVATSPNYLAHSKLLSSYQRTGAVEIIPLGLDESGYQVRGAEKDLARKCCERPFFLFVGVLRYYKGLHVLVEAARGLNCDVIIAGEGPLKEELHNIVRSNKIDNVIFVGQITDAEKSELLRQCVGVVFPSHLRSEAFGVTLLEGAVFSKPLISAEIGTGTTYVNVDHVTGLVVPPGDAAPLRDAMNKLLNNRALCVELGSGARERYERLFSTEVLGESYYNLYKGIIEKNNS